MKETKKPRLSIKIAIMCLLLASIICIAVSISGYYQYRNSTYKVYNSFAYQLANTALAYVDGDTIDSYLQTGSADDKYNDMADNLYKLYSNNGLTSIYICQPEPATLTIKNIYDARIHDAPYPAPFGIGVRDPIGNKNPQMIVDIYTSGLLASDYFIRETSFGFNTSAVIPVRDSTGKPRAILVVDVPMPHIQKSLNEYLLFTIGITVLTVSIFMIFFLAVLQRGVVRPLKLIASEADDFIRRDHKTSDKLHVLRTGDEIEELAASVYKMECDINTYISNLTAITAEKERIGAELDVAKHIQASMLPCIFPAFPSRPELDIYATMTPAKEVGGDFYDFFLVDDDHLAMVMADVSGKGVPAALFMVIAKTLLKNIAQAGLSASEVLNKVNNQLCENNDAEMFVTVWLGLLEISTGTMTCANAGHEYPVLRRAEGKYELIKDKHGPMLAVIEGMKYTEYTIEMHQGDRLYLYTDGVAEATDNSDQLYGTDRMLRALNKLGSAPCDELLHGIKADVDDFVGSAPQFDDITMLALELKA